MIEFEMQERKMSYQHNQPSSSSSTSSYHHPNIPPTLMHNIQDSSKNDNLEYFIKFPSPNLNSTSSTMASDKQPINNLTQDSDFVFVYNETNVPIVMLLGWAGCQDKYLMKYSKIYEDRG